MLARDIMTNRLELINRRATLVDVASKMAALGIGALPVVERHHLIGMVTDRDITIRGVARGLDPAATTVEEVMTPGVVECREDQDVEEVASLMEQHGLRRVVVVNARGKAVGIISLVDLANRCFERGLVETALHQYSGPTQHWGV